MGMKTIYDSTLTAIANAIRAKTGKSASMTPLEMPTEIADIPSGTTPTGTIQINQNGTGIDVAQYAYADVAVPSSGGDTMNDVRLAKTSTSYINNTFSGAVIPFYAFYQCSNLVTCKIPNATGIASNALNGCPNLSDVDFSSVTVVSSYSCQYSFAQDSDVSFPALDDASGNYCFSGCGFKSINIPNVTKVGANAFNNCSRLQSIEFPKTLTMFGGNAMKNCTALQSVKFGGDVTFSGVSHFDGCTNCLLYDFSHCTSVPALTNINSFNNINANAKIVVPDSLYSSWVADSIWSNFSSYIVKASDYVTP